MCRLLSTFSLSDSSASEQTSGRLKGSRGETSSELVVSFSISFKVPIREQRLARVKVLAEQCESGGDL